MKEKNLINLMSAFGMTIQSRDDDQKKIRFSGNGTFVDVWAGKKGVTVGVYNPQTASSFYKRNMNEVKIEDILITLQR